MGTRTPRWAWPADPVPPCPQGRDDAMVRGDGKEGAGSTVGAGAAQEEEAQPRQRAGPGGVEAEGRQ